MIGIKLESFLHRARIRLNCIIITTRVLDFMIWTAIGAGVGLGLVWVAGWTGGNAQIWLWLTLAGGVAGSFAGWHRKWNREKVAVWLDHELGTNEVFAAALVAYQRQYTGAFDRIVVNRAETVADQFPRIKWPGMGLLQRAFMVIVILSIGFSFFYYYGGTAQARKKQRPIMAVSPGPSHSGVMPTPGARPFTTGFSGLKNSPRELAQTLFPDNPVLAEKIAQALETGNMEVFTALMQEAQKNGEYTMQVQIPGFFPAPGNEQAGAESGGKPEDRNNSSKENSNVSQENPQGKNQKTGAKSDKNLKNGANEQNREAGGDQGEMDYSSMLDRIKQTGSGAEPKDAIPFNEGGDGVGKGEASDNWNNQNVTARSGKDKMELDQDKEGPVWEYILPGKNAGVPLGQVIPDFRRAAEAALDRKQPPGEYDEFVRWYFLTLTQEIEEDKKDGGN